MKAILVNAERPNLPFIPDLNGWSVKDLSRLSYDPAFREQCFRRSDPDFALEDSVDGTAKSLIIGHGRRIANSRGCRVSELPFCASDYNTIAALIDRGKMSAASAGPLLDAAKAGDDYDALAGSLGLLIDSGFDLDKAVEEAISSNPKVVADYKSGKKAAANQLLGGIMKANKGADPKSVREKLMARLDKE